jgi:hypothetical protein
MHAIGWRERTGMPWMWPTGGQTLLPPEANTFNSENSSMVTVVSSPSSRRSTSASLNTLSSKLRR